MQRVKLFCPRNRRIRALWTGPNLLKSIGTIRKRSNWAEVASAKVLWQLENVPRGDKIGSSQNGALISSANNRDGKVPVPVQPAPTDGHHLLRDFPGTVRAGVIIQLYDSAVPGVGFWNIQIDFSSEWNPWLDSAFTFPDVSSGTLIRHQQRPKVLIFVHERAAMMDVHANRNHKSKLPSTEKRFWKIFFDRIRNISSVNKSQYYTSFTIDNWLGQQNWPNCTIPTEEKKSERGRNP